MISRAEYLHTKSKLKRFEDQVNNLRTAIDPKWEMAQEKYREWCRYLRTPDDDKKTLIKEWNAYYLAVRNIYLEAGFADLYNKTYSREHRGSLKSLATEINTKAKSAPQPIKPSQPDPIQWEQDPLIGAYLRMRRDIKELRATVEEFQPVYEPKTKLELSPDDYFG